MTDNETQTYKLEQCICRAPIIWATSDRSGLRVAVNAKPETGGTIKLMTDDKGTVISHAIGKTMLTFGATSLRKLHSCQRAKRWRTRQ